MVRIRAFLLLGVLAAGIFFLLFPPSPVRASALSEIDARIAAEEQKRKRLEGRINDYRSRIKELNTRVRTLLERIDQLQQNEAMAGQELDLVVLQL